jgi:saccharopine dehydrogenase (NAD+, L-lysine forming)
MKIGIIREGKNPPDKRAPFTPERLRAIKDQYGDQFIFIVESSQDRCFQDAEYLDAGIEVRSDVSDCDVLFGVKEVPADQLIPEKTYFFFSHTIKKQAKNRNLLKSILDKRIRLIDYEVLKNDSGNRVVAFGRWAGIVGAYNALWTYGKKTALYDLKRAYECESLDELNLELKKVQLPPVKIVVTGAGRVGGGVLEILNRVKIQQVSASDFLHYYYEEPVFTVLHSEDFNRRKSDGGFDKSEFYSNPELYESHFLKFAEAGEILIGAAYWNPEAPKLFEIKDLMHEDFSLSVIADLTCDIDGSIPTTHRAGSIADPIYDIDRLTGEELPPFGSQTSISVMAIDNLPCELPREASLNFCLQLEEWVLPALLEEHAPILERATIAREGDLTLEFMYLEDYISHE